MAVPLAPRGADQPDPNPFPFMGRGFCSIGVD